MDKYLEIKEIFESREDKENAIAMSKFIMILLKLKRNQKL